VTSTFSLNILACFCVVVQTLIPDAVQLYAVTIQAANEKFVVKKGEFFLLKFLKPVIGSRMLRQ
jgi:hypothetical protein